MKTVIAVLAIVVLATGLSWTKDAFAGGIVEKQVHELTKMRYQQRGGVLTWAGTRGLRAEPWWVKNLRQEPWWSRELAPRGGLHFHTAPGWVRGPAWKMKHHRYRNAYVDRWCGNR